MKLNFDCSLLYSDTDSLLYEIRGDDFYKKLADDTLLKQHFDFSNYPPDHFLYNTENKMVTLKFKEEMRGSAIKEFVGLKAKMYSIVYEDKQKMSAKGVCRYAQSSLNHEVYRNVLMTGSLMRSTNIRIGAQKHILRTIRNQKISLSAFDDKRFILEDGITCLPFGHFEIRDLPVFREIVQDDDWGSSQSLETVTNGRNELASSPSWSQIVNDFNVSPPSNVPSLVDLGVSDELDQYVDSEMLSPSSVHIFSPPDPGFNQRAYSDDELGDVADFNEDTADYSLPRGRNPFIDDEAQEIDESFVISDSESPTIAYTQVPTSPSLFQPNPKRRRVVVISSDSDE